MALLHGDIVIVGAGHAGGTLAAQLRQSGYEGSILLIGAEAAPPYQRPPLSKAWLSGKADLEGLLLKPAAFYADKRIDLMTGTEVLSIDRRQKTVTLGDGRSVGYGLLVLATGTRARPLPDAPAGLLTLRTIEDAERIKKRLEPGRHLVIIGGGYVGLEVAASARSLGASCTVLEREKRLLARVASTPLAAFFQSLHEQHGVEFRCGARIARIGGENGDWRIALETGEALACHDIVVGIGAIPNDELARAAGLDCSNGIVVDEEARSSDPAIFAIGDVAARKVAPYGTRLRLESVPNAIEQAKFVAAAVTGRAPPRPEVPWFWSDQYDAKLQIAGLLLDASETVRRDDPQSGGFALFHLKEGVVRCVEAVNSMGAFMGAKLLIASEKTVDPLRLGDPAIAMKDLAA